jgi:hypothetical protein
MGGLNFGGSLFGGEDTQGFPTPRSNQTAKHFTSLTSGAILYTVPAGKRFFITATSISATKSGNNSGYTTSYLKIHPSSGIVHQLNISVGTGNDTVVDAYDSRNFSTPVVLTAGQIIQVWIINTSGNAPLNPVFTITGWEE